MEIIIIGAMAANRVIGREQAIPWTIPDDLHHFRKTTWGHPVIMGRKTFDSLGHSLPGRRNIVLSRNGSWAATGCETAPSLEAALTLCTGAEKIFVIGGEQLYSLALPLAETIILTTIGREVEGDVFFPPFEQEFTLVESESTNGPDPYRIEVYHRKRQV